MASLRILLSCITCVFLGVGVGLLVPRGEKGGAVASVSKQEVVLMPVVTGSNNQLNEQRSRKENVNLNDSWSGREELPEEEVVTIPLSLLRDISPSKSGEWVQGALFDQEDVIAESLGVTDFEKSEIETGWRNVRQQVRDLEVAKAQAESLDDGSARIVIPDNVAMMSRLSRDFRTRLANVLGEDRAKVFASLKNTDERFLSAGEERVYDIEFEEIPNERWRYRIKHEVGGEQRIWVSETIPYELRHLTDDLNIPVVANEGEEE